MKSFNSYLSREAGAAAEKKQLLQIYNDQLFRSIRVVSSKSIKERQETISPLLEAQRRWRNIKKRQCRGRSPLWIRLPGRCSWHSIPRENMEGTHFKSFDVPNRYADLKLLESRLGLNVQFFLELVCHCSWVIGHLVPVHLFTTVALSDNGNSSKDLWYHLTSALE